MSKKKRIGGVQERCALCGYTRIIANFSTHVAPLYGQTEPTEHRYLPEIWVEAKQRRRRDPASGRVYISGGAGHWERKDAVEEAE